MVLIEKIKKRDGRIEKFQPGKIERAVFKAFQATGENDGERARSIADSVVGKAGKKFNLPGVEDIQDLVEETLIEEGYAKVAKAYILYREERAEVRRLKKFFGVKDELKLSVNASKVLEKRYLLKDREGEIIETPSQLFDRVSRAIAKVDEKFNHNPRKSSAEFYQAMRSLLFLPNSPTLMNAGTGLGQLSACFVIKVEDSLESIFDALKHMALVQQSGGGTGFSFSKLRPRGDIVRSTMGVASGPVSFMRIFDVSTDVIKQGGKRRGANMGILRVDHPDILNFIGSKHKEGILENFNISVGATDDFMETVREGGKYSLVNPRSGEEVEEISARDVFDHLVSSAWSTGDPGMIFLDEVNRRNPTPREGAIESTNPCGEVPLLPYESCNLGSINLARVVKKGEIDWEVLGFLSRLGVHFLDNVIETNNYPVAEIERMTKANRKIGLGVMGFAEMLLLLGIPYDSRQALNLGEKVMKFISSEARKKSLELGEERGSFPNFEGSIYSSRYSSLRNATVTTIAPTGTIGIIANTSSGIEPLFAVSFVRNVLEGTKLLEVNPMFKQVAKERGFYSRDLMLKIAKTGSIQGIREVPRDVRRLFLTSMDIPYQTHVSMQAAFQKHVDNAVSKTINLPSNAGLEEVRDAYWLAYKLRCKGITVFRYGSKSQQVLSIGEEGHVSADSEYAGDCPTRDCIV